MLCKCRVCGNISRFESMRFQGTGAVIIEGCTASCPACGGVSDFLDGTFEFTDGEISAVNGPSVTVEIARRFGLIVKKAKQGASITPDDIIAEIADISPELAKKIETRSWGVWALLLLLIWLIKSVELSIVVDVNKLIDQLQGYEQTEAVRDYGDYPLPEEAIINKPTSPTIAAGQGASLPNRKERRRQAALAKKQTKDSA